MQYALFEGKLWLQVCVEQLMTDALGEFKALVRRVGSELVTKDLRSLNLVDG